MLFAVAILSTGLGLAGVAWHTAAKREKEAELLYVGNAYRRAIQRYYETSPGMQRYPRRLEDLLKDERFPSPQRHLRRLYRDPVTGAAQWGLVAAPDGGVMGVYSLSEDVVLKTEGFRERDAALAGGARYSDWKFFYSPPRLRTVTSDGAPARPAPVAAGASPSAANESKPSIDVTSTTSRTPSGR